MPRNPKHTDDETTAATAEPNGNENVAGYFRKVFEENPKLLKERSNQPLYDRWLLDHPGHTEVPRSVRAGLQNIKGVLRQKARKRGRRPARAAEATPAAAVPAKAGRPKAAGRSLERLEGMIDECLFEARGFDAAGFDRVVGLLREARNEVIRQGGSGD